MTNVFASLQSYHTAEKDSTAVKPWQMSNNWKYHNWIISPADIAYTEKTVSVGPNGCYNLIFELTIFLLFHSAAGGEIFDQCVAEREEAFKEKDVKRLMKQILEGVSFLHRNNVVHLDLKVRLCCIFLIDFSSVDFLAGNMS